MAAEFDHLYHQEPSALPSPSALNGAFSFENLQAQRQRLAEYTTWTRYLPMLYDFVGTHLLEWPSLSIEWLPNTDGRWDALLEHNPMFASFPVVYGTNAETKLGRKAVQDNQLVVARIRLPLDHLEEPPSDRLSLTPPVHTFKMEPILGFSISAAVNRARVMPQKSNIIACKTVKPDVVVFDVNKHPDAASLAAPTNKRQKRDARSKGATPDAQDGDLKPEHVEPVCTLKGHTKDGYGLSWSPLRQGHLVSGADDGSICCWDVGGRLRRGMKPIHLYHSHTSSVGDVDWNPFDETSFGSVGEDKYCFMWDTRQNDPAQSCEAHASPINCFAFDPHTAGRFLTGSSDNSLRLWDTRKLDKPVHEFLFHTHDVFQVKWNPHVKNVFASCGVDARVCVWDVSLIGTTQTPEEALDGPPELLFLHGGHTDRLFDFSWNSDPRFKWTVMSTAEDNIVQTWSMSQEIVRSRDRKAS